MRPHREIQQEAEKLVWLGREYLAERRAMPPDGAVVGMPRTLARLPDSFVTASSSAQSESPDTRQHHRQRHIEADIEKDELLFRLIERENDIGFDGRVVREGQPEAVMFSRSGFDLLMAGYELVEEERLGEALAPYADRDDSARGEADPQAVAEVEEILESSSLPVSDRMRAKAEIVEFLEGRLEANEFIQHAIDRQRLREVCAERQELRAEMRLSMHSE